MVQIMDGRGTGSAAKVDAEGRLFGSVVSQGPLEHNSVEGDAAFFYSTFATGTTNIEVVSIKNDEATKRLHITRLVLSSSVNTTWTLFEVTSGTAAGTTLTYQNPNLTSGIANSVTAFGNASVTGSLSGNNLIAFQTLALASTGFFLEGAVILGNGDEIAITASTDGTVHATVIGFWAAAD